MLEWTKLLVLVVVEVVTADYDDKKTNLFKYLMMSVVLHISGC
jgi:hypothetical protein